MLGWRFKVSVALAERGEMLPEGQWVFLCGYYFLAGCGTAASYFGAIIAATKSTPARHSGLGESAFGCSRRREEEGLLTLPIAHTAIGVPCAIFGLSPLFLSALAPYFTVTSSSSSTSPAGINDELDPGRWLLFLAVMLFVVNGLSGFALGEVPWEDERTEGKRRREGEDSGFVGSEESSVVDCELATERTALLRSRGAGGEEQGEEAVMEEQSIAQLLGTPTFWLFGLVIFLSTVSNSMEWPS